MTGGTTQSTNERMRIDGNGNVGIGTTAPTAILHLKAGTAAANTAPLKFSSGVNLTTPEAGAVEFNGTHFYGTIGATRYQLDQQSPTSFTGSLAGDVTGLQSATVVGKINGTALSRIITGILKNTTGTGVPSIAVAADFPTLNQNTTGNAANVTGTVAVANGGTGLTSVTTGDLLYGSAANTYSKLPAGTNGQVLTLTSGIPSWTTNPGTTAWSLTGNSVTAGSQFLGSTNNVSLRFRANNVETMVIDSTGKVGIGTNAPLSDFTISQSSGFNTAKGMRFTGNSVGGTSSGTGFTMALGYNVTNNKQLWLGGGDYVGNSAATFFRFASGVGYTMMDAVAGDNSTRRAISLGVGGDPTSTVILGSDFNSVTPSSYVWDNGNMAIGNGYRANTAPTNGLLVQGNVGIGLTSPTAILHLKAGTATANTAPLKLTSGVNLTTPESGAVNMMGPTFMALLVLPGIN